MITMHRACGKGTHGSATLRTKIVVARPHERLNALLVVCHGWNSPARMPVYQRRSCGRWPQ